VNIEPFDADKHTSVLRVIHNKDFYDKNGLDDPYARNKKEACQAAQHITLEDTVFSDAKAAIAVVIQELAIAQLINQTSPWRSFFLSDIAEALSGISIVASGHDGEKYPRWEINFPKNPDEPLQFQQVENDFGHWHGDMFALSRRTAEHYDKYHHFAWLRKDDLTVCVKQHGVMFRMIHKEDHVKTSHNERIADLRSLFQGVWQGQLDEKTLLYLSGGVNGFDGRFGAKKHMSAFEVEVLKGDIENAKRLIAMLLYPGSSRIGMYPARPFVVTRIASAIQDRFGEVEEEEASVE
jgi:hypothetical protein